MVIMSKLKSFLFYHLPPLVFMILIFWFSSIPNLKLNDSDAEFFRRKIVHLLEYGILWVLIYRALAQGKWLTKFKENLKQAWLAVFLTTLYGAIDEIHQLYVPTRDGKISDLTFDGLGAVLGMGALNLMVVKKKSVMRKTEKQEKQKRPIWPIILGIVIFLSMTIYAFYYYNSYCPVF